MGRTTPWGDWASSQQVQFRYDVHDGGRATAGLSLRGLRVELSASYHSDALGDLLRSVLLVAEGELEASCSWDAEPGEYCWLLRRASDAALVRIVHRDPHRAGAISVVGHTVWEGTVPVLDLVEAVVEAARGVLARWGPEGYRAAWRTYDFPAEALARLEGHLPAGTGGFL